MGLGSSGFEVFRGPQRHIKTSHSFQSTFAIQTSHPKFAAAPSNPTVDASFPSSPSHCLPAPGKVGLQTYQQRQRMDSLISRFKESTYSPHAPHAIPPSLIYRTFSAELEVLRLEKRYAKRTHRAAYRGSAVYRDGEYVRAKSGKDITVREAETGPKKRVN